MNAAQILAQRASRGVTPRPKARPVIATRPAPRNLARRGRESGGFWRGLALGVKGFFLALGAIIVGAWKSLLWTVGVGLGLAVFAALAVGFLAGFRWVEESDYFTLREVVVSGTQRLAAEDVVSLAGVGVGTASFDLSLPEVERRLSGNPWIASAAVRRVLPGSLHITIAERLPAFWVARGQGLAYADAAGQPIAPVTPEDFVSLPVLVAEPGSEDRLPALLRALGTLRDINPAWAPERAAWIRLGFTDASLYFDAPDLTLTLGRESGEEPWKSPLERLRRVWKDLARRGERDGVRSLTVRGSKAWASVAG